MVKLRIAQLGSYPPPFGGVSVHIKRLHEYLLEKPNVISHVYNFSSNAFGINVINMKDVRNWVRIVFLRKDIYHCHVTSKHWIWLSIYFLFARINGARFIVTYHSLRFDRDDFSRIARIILRYIFSNTEKAIVSNRDIKSTLEKLGMRREKIHVVPAFILPKSTNDKLPQQIVDFINARSPIISAYAYSINNLESNDLYGVKLFIKSCKILSSKYPNIGFVLCITHAENSRALSYLKEMVKNSGLGKNMLIYNKAVSNLYLLWGESDIYVRPTLSDGDSIALREALNLKTPSVASNSVKRPADAILFESNSILSLANKVIMVLDNYSYYKSILEKGENINNAEKIYELYSQNYAC